MSGHVVSADYAFIAFVSFIGTAVVVGMIAQRLTTKACLRKLEMWERDSNLSILERDSPLWDQGPFTLKSTQWHRVFRLKIKTGEGREEIIWVRIGKPWFYTANPPLTVDREVI